MSTLNLVNPNPYSMSFCWPLTPKRCSPASSLQPNMFYPWFKFAAAARVSCNSRLRPPSLLSSSPLPQSQVFNCPQLREISLEFSRQENDSIDLITMIKGLGRNLSRLKNIHISCFEAFS
ncbi:hypothetical protein AAHE18_03G119700 [Arachis hypogaea]|nr:F-box/LRR-repeat protein [Arachis hypogaea]